MTNAETVALVRVQISCPGYHSEMSFPIGTDPAEAFIPWFEMQLSYFRRWKPGSTADHRETIPTPPPIDGSGTSGTLAP